MAFRSFRNNYHDGQLESFQLGPRRELTISVDLDPVWNPTTPFASVRFGGISNYEEIKDFMRALPEPEPNGYIDEVVGLVFVGKGPNWVVLDLSRNGSMVVQARNVTEL